ncbi:MAG TPA: hypothetical protein VFG50_13100, partial [Rhodothermales bacterium]|nr:hypothetical protein [Rhodothermales bacterium]
MFRGLYFQSNYGPYLRNEDGTEQFAERCLDHLIRGVTKKSAVYRELTENMLVEKASLRMRAAELQEQPMLDAGEFFSVRRRLWVNNVIVTAVVISGIFLNFLSLSAFISMQTGVSAFLSWMVSIVLSIVLMGGGLIATERFIEALVPRQSFRTPELKEVSRSVAPLWLVLLIGIELALLGIAEVRASQLSASLDSGMIFYGFIIMTMMLPIIAGAVRWDVLQYVELYQTTQALRQIDNRLAQIDSILRQNEEYESNYYKMKSISYWDLLNEFKTYKANYNRKKGIVEHLDGHFAGSYDTFQAEANKRFRSDIRDVSATSIRKLNLVEATTQPVGSKIGQIKARSPRSLTDGGPAAASQTTDVYLNPQPIR